MSEEKISYKEVRNATVCVDNSVDTGRVYDISADVSIQGQSTVESFQNGTVMKDGVQVASFNCWGDGTNVGINYTGIASEKQCEVLEAVGAFIKDVKGKVESGGSVIPDPEPEPEVEPEAKEVVNQQLKFSRMMINTMSLTDEQALEVKDLYPLWEDLIGTTVEKDSRLTYEGVLYKVLQEHEVQEQWKPGTDTASLYGIVSASASEEHAGTKEDPIPYVQMMVLEKGKYYTQDGVLYECIQGTVTGYPNDLKDLASLVKKVEE